MASIAIKQKPGTRLSPKTWAWAPGQCRCCPNYTSKLGKKIDQLCADCVKIKKKASDRPVAELKALWKQCMREAAVIRLVLSQVGEEP